MCKDPKQIRCLFETTKKFDKFKYITTCPRECDSVSYSFEISSSKYPTENHLINMINRTNLGNIGTNYSEIKKSLLAFHIFYSELKRTEISETEKMSIIDLLSFTGGTFSLFIGASILSLVEFIEAFIILILTFIKRSTNHVADF